MPECLTLATPLMPMRTPGADLPNTTVMASGRPRRRLFFQLRAPGAEVPSSFPRRMH